MTLRVRGHTFGWDPARLRVRLMGVVNVTPDSFSDGGRFLDPAAAYRHACALVAEGAEILDVGAESTRPGSRGVSAAEEQDRLLPVLERLLKEPPCPVSVDTAKAEVAGAALALGAHMVNDVTGLAGGPELARLCARHGAALCLVHMRGTPATMQAAPHYDDLLGEVRERLGAAVAAAEAAGVAPDAICIDPGIGFGKTVAHNLTLLKRLDGLALLGKPILVGPSRKSFIGAVLDLPPAERLEGTLAACVAAVQAGAHILRVHDVGAVRRAVRVAEAIRDAPER
ncbi:MAG: dihydropteroate synthase [Candidatus Rokubacteria bacterium]|nr:dihydropteroate synthase [Candidatus Rokubacteria bacterium]